MLRYLPLDFFKEWEFNASFDVLWKYLKPMKLKPNIECFLLFPIFLEGTPLHKENRQDKLALPRTHALLSWDVIINMFKEHKRVSFCQSDQHNLWRFCLLFQRFLYKAFCEHTLKMPYCGMEIHKNSTCCKHIRHLKIQNEDKYESF